MGHMEKQRLARKPKYWHTSELPKSWVFLTEATLTENDILMIFGHGGALI